MHISSQEIEMYWTEIKHTRRFPRKRQTLLFFLLSSSIVFHWNCVYLYTYMEGDGVWLGQQWDNSDN